MKPREEEQLKRKPPDRHRGPERRRFRLVKLEERIAPSGVVWGGPARAMTMNHNERLVRGAAKAAPKPARPRQAKGRFRLVKLEERIAPSGIVVQRG